MAVRTTSKAIDTQRRPVGSALVALAAVTWGTIGVVVSLLYRIAQTDALSIGFLRLAIAAPALLLVSRVFAGRDFLRIAPRDRWVMVVIGAAFATYQVTYFAAIPRIGVATAVLINICSAPIFIALLAALFLREQITRIVVVALLVAICGTGLLVNGPNAATTQWSPLGALLALAAGLSYAIVAVASRSVATRYHPTQPIAIAFTLGALFLLPVLLSHGLVLPFSPLAWLLLLHLGLVPTMLGYVLYLWGLRTTPATTSGVLALLEPLISTLLAVAFLGEHLASRSLLGAVLLLGSVVLLLMRKPEGSSRTTPRPEGTRSPAPGIRHE